jgi:hypothetical protein
METKEVKEVPDMQSVFGPVFRVDVHLDTNADPIATTELPASAGPAQQHAAVVDLLQQMRPHTEVEEFIAKVYREGEWYGKYPIDGKMPTLSLMQIVGMCGMSCSLR